MLKDGTACDEALWQGICAMRKHPQWKHPFYWSTFVLIGNGD
jgi:CHAT domain-containing protein